MPKLEIPFDTDYLIIETDGSALGWGAVLVSKPNKTANKTDERICRYASGSFREKGEISTIDLELLAIYYALESFEFFIIGKLEFTIRTDCIAIVKYYNNLKKEKKRSYYKRWQRLTSLILQKGYKPCLEHIEGNNNKIIDILSRLLQFSDKN